MTRGPDSWRLASLLTTAQLEVVVLAEDDVAALRDGRAPFEAFGPTELRTLSEHAGELASAAPAEPAASPVPVHPGAIAYAAGEPLPPTEATEDARVPPDHVH